MDTSQQTLEKTVSAANENTPQKTVEVLLSDNVISQLTTLETDLTAVISGPYDGSPEKLKAARDSLNALIEQLQRAKFEATCTSDGKLAIIGSLPTSSALLTKSGIIKPSDIIGKNIGTVGVPLRTKLVAANGNTADLRVLGFLGDENGNLARYHFIGAIKEITKLNNGMVYGTGTEQYNARALARGEFKKNTIILATFDALKELSGSYECSSDDRGLKKDGRLSTDYEQFKAMSDIIASGSDHGSWSVSSREDSVLPRLVVCVGLRGGYDVWALKDLSRGLAVVLQCG